MLLTVKDLVISCRHKREFFPVVDQVSLDVGRSENVGLVGESGCGKSMLALSLLRLLPSGSTISGGKIYWRGEDLLTFTPKRLRALRGKELSMIFQEPLTSLNPVYTIGKQLMEVFVVHEGLSARAAHVKALEMLEIVQIPAAAKRFNEYQHQLSGGMRQRVLIAMALACKPRLLLADEPTTALDVTIQAQILQLIQDLQAEFKMSMLFISHDLAVVAAMCERVLVMYAGKIVESGPTRTVFTTPLHPYTQALLQALPRLGVRRARLATIEGNVPPLNALPRGCRFQNRCVFTHERCLKAEPPLLSGAESQQVACWLQESQSPKQRADK